MIRELRRDDVCIFVRRCPEFDKEAFFILYDRMDKAYDLVCRDRRGNIADCILWVIDIVFEKREHEKKRNARKVWCNIRLHVSFDGVSVEFYDKSSPYIYAFLMFVEKTFRFGNIDRFFQ